MAMKSPLDMLGTALTINHLSVKVHKSSCAVEVTNIPKGTSHDHIVMLLESFRSGGGPIRDAFYEGHGRAIVTYETVEGIYH